MKYYYYLVAAIALTVNTNVFAQDYYDDINGDGLPILKGSNGGLFGARLNVKYNSIKVNFFTFLKSVYSYPGGKEGQEPVSEGTVLPSIEEEPVPADKVKKWGVGLSIKAKTEQNIGSIFSAGVFSPGFQGGGYVVRRTIHRISDKQDSKEKMKFSTFNTLVFSAQYNSSTYRLYDNTLPFDKMKIDSAYNGYSFSVSFFTNKPVGRAYTYSADRKTKKYEGRPNNLILGISGELALKNNYSKLQQYEIKDYLVSVTDPVTGITRTIQLADDEGYGYSKNNYKEYLNFKIRPHINFIPGILNQTVGMIFYPSYDIIEKNKPRMNFGLGLHILEKDNPGISKVGIYFEFNDVSNGAEVKDKTFIERSFSVGIGAAFNMFTGKKL